MESALYGEVYRLKSNHSELLMHKRTLERQLEMKQEHLMEIEKAVAECKKLYQQDEEMKKREKQ